MIIFFLPLLFFSSSNFIFLYLFLFPHWFWQTALESHQECSISLAWSCASYSQVEKILDEREKKGKKEYLVQWKNMAPKHNTWEPEENLMDCKEALRSFFNSLKKVCQTC